MDIPFFLTKDNIASLYCEKSFQIVLCARTWRLTFDISRYATFEKCSIGLIGISHDIKRLKADGRSFEKIESGVGRTSERTIS